jgi:uncharacterized protein YigE (DUF2233 family)
MKLLKNNFILLISSLCLVSFMAMKGNSRDFLNPEKINSVEILPVDSFQLLVDEYCNVKKTQESSQKNEKKKKELQRLLPKIRNYTSKINGSRTVIFKDIKYFIFVANLDSDEIRMHLYNPENKNFHTLGAVKKYLEEKKIDPLMITNAGMFTRDDEPEGLYIEENSKTFFALDTAKDIPNANFYLKPNGVFYIDENNIPHIDTTEQFARINNSGLKKIKAATQSGPMLVINGNIHKAFIPGSSNRKSRSGVGLIKGNDKKVVFAITEGESNFYDFALFYRDIFNCDNALFLDGVISQMYLHDLNPDETGGNFGPMISVARKYK